MVDIFQRIAKELAGDVPLKVINDGEVSRAAGFHYRSTPNKQLVDVHSCYLAVMRGVHAFVSSIRLLCLCGERIMALEPVVVQLCSSWTCPAPMLEPAVT